MPADARPVHFVLHLGAHKTATTTIQRSLRSGANQLRAHGLEPIWIQDNLSEALAGTTLMPAGRDVFRNFLDQQAATRSSSTLIISYEAMLGERPMVAGQPGFYPKHRESIAALREALQEHSFTIVFAIRDQASLIESWYVQTLKTGGRRSFVQFVDKLDFASLRWSEIVEAMSAVFGAKNIVVIDYSLLAAQQNDPIAVFMSAIGVDDLALPASEPHNVMYSAKAIAMAQALRPYLDTPADVRRFRSFLQRHYSATPDTRPRLLGAALRSRLDEQYRRDLAGITELGVRILPATI